MQKMEMAVCAEESMAGAIEAGIDTFWHSSGIKMQTDWFDRREDLLYGMRGKKYAIVVVALFGALGMEAAIGAREENAGCSIVWISNEEAFALQSYRLQTKVFLICPVLPEHICGALWRCIEKCPDGKRNPQ